MAGSQKRTSLTKRQQEVFEFLKDKIVNRGYGPTVREIGEHFRIRSPNGVMCHLKALEKKGLIHRESNMSRAICLSESSQAQASLPFFGTAVSGSPLQAARTDSESVVFESMFDSGDNVCLRVQGPAFQSLGISDGDYIVVSRSGKAGAGSLVAALDDQESVALCRVSANSRQLVPAIPGAYPVPVKEVLGAVVGVIRQFHQATNGQALDISELNPV